MSIRDFQIISKLGEGAYSSVYKVKRLTDGYEYALKKVKLLNLSDKEKQNALNEVRILASIRHPNIIGYKEAFLDENSNSLCIVMEFANNGDLYQKIVEYQKKGAFIPEVEIWSTFLQMIKGLKALHDFKIFHRDLKSANVFLNKDGSVKLGDLNVSKIAKKGLLYTQTGTPYYASPEVWRDQPYDHKSDVWSAGCVLYEMTTLKPPFRAEDMEGLYKKVIRGHYPKIPSHYSQDLNNVIRVLLQVSPQLRPNCEVILQIPAVTKRLDDKILTEFEETPQADLLNTIRIPKNLHFLTEKLPKPNYAPTRTKKIEKYKFLQALSGHHDSMNSNDNSLNEIKLKASESVDTYKKEKFDRENRLQLPSLGYINNPKDSGSPDIYKLLVIKEYKEHEKEKLEREKLKHQNNNNYQKQEQGQQQPQQHKQQQLIHKINIEMNDNNDNHIELASIKKDIIKKKKRYPTNPNLSPLPLINYNVYDAGNEKLYEVKSNKKIAYEASPIVNNHNNNLKPKANSDIKNLFSDEDINDKINIKLPSINGSGSKLPVLVKSNDSPLIKKNSKANELNKIQKISMLEDISMLNSKSHRNKKSIHDSPESKLILQNSPNQNDTKIIRLNDLLSVDDQNLLK